MSKLTILKLLKELIESCYTDMGNGCDSGCCSGTRVVTYDDLMKRIDEKIAVAKEPVK